MKSIRTIFLSAAFLAAVSCSGFLDEKSNPNYLTPDSFWHSEADINKAVNEAKQYEEEDKKRKEGVESHNKLDGMIFTVEKSITDLGDKISAEDKAKLEEEIKTAKTELESNDKDRMDKAFEQLSNVSQGVFAKIYQQAQAENPNAGAQNGGENGGDTEFHQN